MGLVSLPLRIRPLFRGNVLLEYRAYVLDERCAMDTVPFCQLRRYRLLASAENICRLPRVAGPHSDESNEVAGARNPTVQTVIRMGLWSRKIPNALHMSYFIFLFDVLGALLPRGVMGNSAHAQH